MKLEGLIDSIENGKISGWIRIRDIENVDKNAIKISADKSEDNIIENIEFYPRGIEFENNTFFCGFTIKCRGMSQSDLIHVKHNYYLKYQDKELKLEIWDPIKKSISIVNLSKSGVHHFFKYLNVFPQEGQRQAFIKTAASVYEYLLIYGNLPIQEEQIHSIFNSFIIHPNIKVSIINKILYDSGLDIKSINSILDGLDNSHIKKGINEFLINKLYMVSPIFINESLNILFNRAKDFVFVAMHKDEGYLLLIWALYYIQVAGPKRILIFDNGSTDPLTCNILRCLETMGIEINYKFKSATDYQERGNWIVKETHSLMGDDCNIFLLDIDEFLYSFYDNSPSFDPRIIYRDVNEVSSTLMMSSPLIRIYHGFRNIPGTYNIFNAKINRVVMHRTFYNSGGQGMHYYVDKNNQLLRTEKLGYLHFHHRYYSRMISNAQDKLRELVDFTNPESLMNYKGDGHHLTKFLLNDRNFYNSYLCEKYEKSTFNCEELWKQCGLPWPI